MRVFKEFLDERGMYAEVCKQIDRVHRISFSLYCMKTPARAAIECLLYNNRALQKEWIEYLYKRRKEVFYEFLVEEGILFDFMEHQSNRKTNFENRINYFAPHEYLSGYKSQTIAMRKRWNTKIKEYGLV